MTSARRQLELGGSKATHRLVDAVAHIDDDVIQHGRERGHMSLHGDRIRVVGALAGLQGVAAIPTEVDKSAYAPIWAHILRSPDHPSMTTTVAELDISSAEARVASAPANRDLKSAVRRVGLRRVVLYGLALVIGSGATWYGHQWWTVGRFIESTDDAYVGGDVTVIAPKVAGFIAELAVTDNQAVHAGDLLVKLDDRDYRAALAKPNAAVAAQEATLANLDATRRLQASMIAQAEAEVAAADAEGARSRFDVVRYSRLASDQYASLQRFQQADADNKKAIAAVEKA